MLRCEPLLIGWSRSRGEQEAVEIASESP